MVNIAKLLEDAPRHIYLYSPLFGKVKFLAIDSADSTIIVETERGTHEWFSACGIYKVMKSHLVYSDAECLLFPSEDCRTWKGWEVPIELKFKVGDRVIFRGKVRTITSIGKNYYHFDEGVAGCCIEKQDELLSVAPKFKTGDWLVYKDGSTFCGGLRTAQVQSIEEHVYTFTHGTNSNHHFIDSECRLWTIQDAKDGDVLVSGINNPFIYNGNIEFLSAGAYVGVSRDGRIRLDMFPSKAWTSVKDVKPATKEQRDLFFAKMKEAGYEWDEKKKELREIKPHYDIANFHAGMPVLIRDRNENEWCHSWYSHYCKSGICHFNAVGLYWKQCIPFEGNEHLLGTTDMCDEMYINW